MTGQDDSALGFGALGSVRSGLADSALGFEALSALTTGISNSAVGYLALSHVTTGFNDVGLGRQAGSELTTGSGDVLLGPAVGFNYSSSESNDIIIGDARGSANPLQGTASENNTIRIGNAATQTFISGIAGVTPPSVSGSAPVAVVVNRNGQLGVQSSSIRFKRDIHPLGTSAVSELLRLRPVSFRYKKSWTKGPWPIQFGLIAEQVAKVLPNLVSYGVDHKPDGVAYQELAALLLAAVKAQQGQISGQSSQLRSERQQINSLQRRVAALVAVNRRLSHQQTEINWLMSQVRHGKS